MSAPDSVNPSIQYPNGLRLNTRDVMIGNGMAFRDAADTVQTVSKATPLPVDISGVTFNVASTGLAQQATLVQLLAATATAANQTAELALLTSILAALTTGSSTFDSVADITVPTAGTAVQGSNVATPNGVILSGRFTNTQPVYVGGSGVTNAGGSERGIALVAGGMTPILPVTNLNQIYINADVNGEGVGVVIR